jgi:hypothetical protein
MGDHVNAHIKKAHTDKCSHGRMLTQVNTHIECSLRSIHQLTVNTGNVISGVTAEHIPRVSRKMFRMIDARFRRMEVAFRMHHLCFKWSIIQLRFPICMLMTLEHCSSTGMHSFS